MTDHFGVTSPAAVSHETIGKFLEKSRYYGFCIPRRHTPCWPHPKSSTVSFRDYFGNFEKIWFHHQFDKVHPQTNPKYQQHLGFNIDLNSGHLKVPKEKLKGVRRELGKLVTHTHMSSRRMAAILGVVRACLPALPILKAFTDTFVQFVNKKSNWVGILFT